MSKDFDVTEVMIDNERLRAEVVRLKALCETRKELYDLMEDKLNVLKMGTPTLLERIGEQAKDGKYHVMQSHGEWFVLRWDKRRGGLWLDQKGAYAERIGVVLNHYRPTHYIPLPIPEVPK